MRDVKYDTGEIEMIEAIGDDRPKSNDIAVCPLCGKYFCDVFERKGSLIGIKCKDKRCGGIVKIRI